jgi:hypothetical protein
MVSAHAPVEARQTERTPPRRECIDVDLLIGKKSFAASGNRQRLARPPDETATLEAVEQQDPHVAGEVVVAYARFAQREIVGPVCTGFVSSRAASAMSCSIVEPTS